MRQMADAGHHIVMFLIRENQRNGSQRSHQIHIGGDFGKFCLVRRRDDIIGVFQQIIGRIGKTCFFRPRHGVAADEIGGEACCGHGIVHLTLHAAHIRQNTAGTDGLLQKRQIGNIRLYGSAQKYVITGCKKRILLRTGNVDHSFCHRFVQRASGMGIGQQFVLRVKFPDGSSDGTADQPQADKSDTSLIHVTKSFLPGVYMPAIHS